MGAARSLGASGGAAGFRGRSEAMRQRAGITTPPR
jgi:hypothetical protein